MIINRIINHLPISHPSPTAWARRILTELFCSTKESCAPPGQQAMTFRMWQFASDIIWTLTEWYNFQLRNGNGSGEEALIRICMQSLAPMIFGSPAIAKKSILTSISLSVVYGNNMYWGIIDIIDFSTLGGAWLKEDCEIPDLSSVSLWNDPAARTLSALSHCSGA